METDYERGYKDGMAGAALPNIIDNGDKIDGYAYSYKTDSEGIPYINIDSVRAMLTKAAGAQSVKRGKWVSDKCGMHCSCCNKTPHTEEGQCGCQTVEDYILSDFCPNCGADMRNE